MDTRRRIFLQSISATAALPTLRSILREQALLAGQPREGSADARLRGLAINFRRCEKRSMVSPIGSSPGCKKEVLEIVSVVYLIQISRNAIGELG